MNIKVFEKNILNTNKVYIYKIDFILGKYHEIVKLILKFDDRIIESEWYSIDIYQQLFIYSYKINYVKSFRSFFNNLINNNSKETYDLSDLQKYIIYKNILENNQLLVSLIPFLNEQSSLIINEFEKHLNKLFSNIINENSNNQHEYIMELTDYIKNYISAIYEIKNNDITLFKNIFLKYVNGLTKDKFILRKYFILKDNINNYIIDNLLKQQIINYINDTIHKTGKDCIENNYNFKNIEIIKFIIEDSKIYSTDYQNIEDFAFLIGNINFNDITIDDNEFIDLFKKTEFKKIYGQKYSLFLDTIFESINNFEKLEILYLMFENTIDDDILSKLMNIYLKKDSMAMNISNIKTKKLSKIIGILFKLCSERNYNEERDKLINFTKKNFSEDYKYILIFMKILVMYSKLNNYTKTMISKVLNECIIKKEEFLNFNLSENVKILLFLNKKKIFQKREIQKNKLFCQIN
ncbi:hypothetical protein BCR32DRAFT_244736 [Anaeromyces robustus]|uniref:Uncharacterized protein n=1 Tax=Anaeromyces robustus TaxID=1754192 RepID=A0A1Y1X7G5_9FUNG|nr:hypothetical protein BCR32DRAFT_244736 [Anaeromyces robustus]|eukprot:ORX81685.1 hypothetical protein BCR32DRAFT_244736 [Anaeromyces robustus]